MNSEEETGPMNNDASLEEFLLQYFEAKKITQDPIVQKAIRKL